MSSATQGAGSTLDLTQFYEVFFEEANENLAAMEQMLLAVDVDNPAADDLNAIFRAAHSIKGGAATFGFADVTGLTHELETLLDKVRRRELPMTAVMVDVLLESGDVVKAQLAGHQPGATRSEIDTTDLVARIRELATGRPKAVAAGSAFEMVVGPCPNAITFEGIEELFSEIESLGTIEHVPHDGADEGGEQFRRYRVTSATPRDELVDLMGFHVSREQVRFADAAGNPGAANRAKGGKAGKGGKAVSGGKGGTGGKGKKGGKAAAQASTTTTTVTAPAATEDPGFEIFDHPHDAHAGAAHDPAGASAETQADPATTAAAASHDAVTHDVAPAASATSAASAAAVPARAEARSATPANTDATTLRVSIEKVDQLINLVGELVITQAMLSNRSHAIDPIEHAGVLSGLADLERNTRALQESVMGIRMIPMAVVFNRFPRMLRDLAAKLGKQIDLKTSGEATELDKGLIEKIIDPLTHLIRNSVDHGIEMPEARVAANKPARGTISLSASHRGGNILIEVKDDGAGLNRQKILKKARERGMDVSDSMTDGEVWQLIWAPGFSTADKITDVSGRGVGMDVVTKNIASLGGTAEIDSKEGEGTRVSVRLPLTLAIMDGMSVAVDKGLFIIPLSNIVESMQLTDGMLKTVGASGLVVQVRSDFLTVVALSDVLRGGSTSRVSDGGRILVIVESDGAKVALLVDELIGQHQVVVKNLETNYRKVPGVSGATIMGDGSVALILDAAYVVSAARARSAAVTASRLVH